MLVGSRFLGSKILGKMVISQISLVHSSKTMIKGKRSQLPIETGIANNKRSLHDNNHFRLEYWMPALLNNEAQKEAPQYRLTVQLLCSPGCHTVGCRRRANKHPIAAQPRIERQHTYGWHPQESTLSECTSNTSLYTGCAPPLTNATPPTGKIHPFS